MRISRGLKRDFSSFYTYFSKLISPAKIWFLQKHDTHAHIRNQCTAACHTHSQYVIRFKLFTSTVLKTCTIWGATATPSPPFPLAASLDMNNEVSRFGIDLECHQFSSVFAYFCHTTIQGKTLNLLFSYNLTKRVIVFPPAVCR